MDSDYQLDLSEVRRHLDQTQVVGFFFPFLRRTLLIDTRTSSVDGPLVIVTPMVNSVDERIRSLRRLRPRFPKPESMTLIPWPRWIEALQRLGVWEMIERRVTDLGGDPLRGRCEEALAELLREERLQVKNAITGEGYQTLWEREE
jgi:hypothetical protein